MTAPFTAHALLWITSVLAFFMTGGTIGTMLGGIGGAAVLFAFLLAVGITGWGSAQAFGGTGWATGWATGLAFLAGLGEAAGDAVLGVGSALMGDTDLGKSNMRVCV